MANGVAPQCEFNFPKSSLHSTAPQSISFVCVCVSGEVKEMQLIQRVSIEQAIKFTIDRRPPLEAGHQHKRLPLAQKHTVLRRTGTDGK